MVVGDLGERDLLVTFSPFLIILVLILAELAAAIGAKTVKMAAVCQSHRVGLSTGDRDNLLVVESLNACWVWLIGLVLCVLWQITDIVKTQLSKRRFSPCIDISFLCKGHRVRISTG